MKVQGRLMQAQFIEVHQVFAKKKRKRSDTFITELTNSMVYGTRRFNTAFTRDLQ